MPRLFLGTFLSLEQQAAFAKLKEINPTLGPNWQCQVRWVQSSKLHLTWLFIGEVPSMQTEELPQVLEEVLRGKEKHDQLTLTYDRLEAWCVQGAPRHVVLTPTTVSESFFDLAKDVRRQLSRFAADQARDQAAQPLKPHITLMRLERRQGLKPSLPQSSSADGNHPLNTAKKVREIALDYSKIDGLLPLMPVIHNLTNLSLIESDLGGSSHQYRILKNFDLS